MATRIIGGVWLIVIVLLIPGMLLTSQPTIAYQTYHDPNQDGAGFCAECHQGFPNRGPTHDMHVGNSQFVKTCDFCHTGNGRNNPFTMWSTGSGAGTQYGCAGCHGRDYGETIQSDHDNGTALFAISGSPKMSGYGLRKQHLNKGITRCLDCHQDVPRCLIKGEDVAPPFYSFSSDVTISDLCSSSQEDGSGEQPPGTEDSIGLDNDGDGRSDQADPDCNSGLATTPGEAADACGPGDALLVSSFDAGTGDITLSYGIPCSATSSIIYLGPLTFADVAAYNYTGQECVTGTGGSHTFNPGAGDYFFLVAGSTFSEQGSLGQAPIGFDPNTPSRAFYVERPWDPNNSCSVALDPNGRCD